MPLKTYRTVPPGGWIFVQYNQDGVTELKKFKFSGPVRTIIEDVIAFRSANSIAKADYDSVITELDDQTCQRLGWDPKWCTPDGGLKKKSNPLYSAIRVARRAQSVGKKLLSGSQTLRDWLGDGAIPVPEKTAQARADVCVGCKNNTDRGLLSMMTSTVASSILNQRREKSGLKLAVDGEDKIMSCSVCLCHLPLKVWVPLEHIMTYTTQDDLQSFPSHCWMVTEQPTQTKQTPP